VSFFKNTYKVRAALTSLMIHLFLVFIFYSFGLKYMDPKIEEGIAIEFGYFDEGIGDVITESEEIHIEPIEVIEEIQASLQSEDSEIAETFLTQDIEEVEVAVQVKEKANAEEENKFEKEVQKDAKASKKLQNALSSLFQSKNNTESGSTDISGSQGNQEGSLTGLDKPDRGEGNSSDGYELGNRTVIRKPKPKYSCSETGRVVIRVWVNAEGITYKAELDLKNTTETDPCLVREAKSAALQTTWLKDVNIGPVQIGSIIYNFRKL
tara:strand:+ start:609 stop:1406 length:798 start_codon:yes stop_codon:yes gene_type:complete